MFKKRSVAHFTFALVTVISLFFTSLGITPVYAASIVVNTAADEINTNGKCSLREAIHNANNDAVTYPGCAGGIGTDTITFAGNYTITLSDELPIVTSVIIINGNGAANTIIQASTCNPVTLPGGCTPADYRVFAVSDTGNLTLNGLSVRHGRCNDSCEEAGGIYNGGTLSLVNSTISGNSALIWGGGIYNTGDLTVTNSTLSGNSAGSGGGIYNAYGDPTITNSIIQGNTAGIPNSGGGLYNFSGTLTVINSILSGNSAGYGGGIFNYDGTLAVTNSTLSGNSAIDDGGGIRNAHNATLYMGSSTLSGNSAGTGGGISNYSTGNMWIFNSTLSSNEASDYGGGIDTEGGAWIHNSTIAFNTLWEGIDDLGVGGINGNAALYNSIVAGNTRISVAGTEYRDCFGTITLWGVNAFWNTTNCNLDYSTGGYSTTLISLSELGPLQNNGGPTKTHALLPVNDGESRVIDAGDNDLCAAWPVNNIDQRGKTRPQGSVCDVGAYEAPVTTTIYSNGTQDGWVLESSETSGNGGTMNSTASLFYLGDNATKKQYRAILSFNTSSLPDNAIITKVTLKLKKRGINGGGNPLTMFQGFMMDVKKGFFGTTSLALADFKATAHKTVGPQFPALTSGWYSLNLTPAKAYVNKLGTNSGLTQIRLRFKLDDNNNAAANFLKLYSGNAGAANRPQLIVEYYIP